MRSSRPAPLSLRSDLDAVRAGATTVTALVDRALDAVTRDDELHAWVLVDAAGARRQAARLDRVGAELPLRGAVVGVKDILDVAGLPTRHGSPIHADAPPAGGDAALVGALRAAGAVVLGKTVTTEFAFLAPSVTRNPLDPARTPGGSSSGSAAAVGAGMVPLALGSQTAGSIIRPAAYCGIAGLKPSAGVLSRAGMLRMAASLDTPGFLAASAGDLLAVAEAVLPTAPPGAADGPPRLGWWPTSAWDRIEPEARAALEAVVAAATAAGARVETADGPQDGAIAEAQRTIMAAEAAEELGPQVRGREADLSPELAALLAAGRALPAARVGEARATAAAAQAAWARQLGRFDALLTPSTLGVPPLGLGSTGDPELCRVWTLLGVPAVALPLAWTPSGLPAGLQLVGAHGADRALLRAAMWLEEHVPPAAR
jgi:Asp-tRNA(Asn)/Glu-tRNA(Gln) amidotransferase A subunit family amidase